jgi:hypothetical protein
VFFKVVTKIAVNSFASLKSGFNLSFSMIFNSSRTSNQNNDSSVSSKTISF